MLALVLVLAAATPFQESLAELARSKAKDPQKLHRLFDLAWQYDNAEHPELATSRGVAGYNNRWTDESLEAIERRKHETVSLGQALSAIDRRKVDAQDQVNYDLFRRDVDDDLAAQRFPRELLAITQLAGPQYLSSTLDIMPARTARDYQDIVARLDAVPQRLVQVEARLRRGVETGVVSPRVVLRDVAAQLDAQTPEDPLQAPLLKAFAKLPEGISEEARTDAVRIYREKIVPAYRKLREYFVSAYLPHARETVALSALPEGVDWYLERVRRETTTSLTPHEIHQLGLSEVKRIRGEMEKVLARVGFKGTLADFATFLRTDARFYFTDARELVREYRDIAKRIDPELTRLFGKLPRLPYGVVEIPAFSAPSQTTAYYRQGSPEAHRPGSYFVNTFKLDTRPKWEMEALTLHESVPGHHLQIAISQELTSVPEFRKTSRYVAESLGPELGMYQDPYSQFGQLTYEMWRAIRLVVDTGMHALGWSRDQAIDYFRQNSAKTEHDIVVEIDRYIVMPGQALAYKIGELKLKELRALASKELGAKFDVRTFHDAVLGSGALPLDVLEENIRAFIAQQRR
ncbi:MAG: DUF885 domain-containing protein [Deltaproteobacteria bacterium]|nr:MAG: DUF885 domain-containing protein [Deltaproteobacteria bacterium]